MSRSERRNGGRRTRKGIRDRLNSDRPRNIVLPSPKVDGSLRARGGRGAATPSWGRVARTLSIASAEEALAALTPTVEQPSPTDPRAVQRRKPTTPSTPDVNTGTPAYQQLVQEVKFLCDEVPHFKKITEDIPMAQDSDVEAQTTFVFQLLKWILEYGKPAVVDVDRAEKEAYNAQNELEQERDGVRKDMERLDIMVRELNLENQELKDRLYTAQEDLAFFESQMDDYQETDEQENIVQIEHEQTLHELDEKVQENENLQKDVVSLRAQLTDVRKSADELLEAYHAVIRDRDAAVRELRNTQTLAANMERKYQAQMAHLDASNERLEQDLETAQQEKIAAVTVRSPIVSPRNPTTKHGRQESRVIAIATDYELNEADMSMLEYSPGGVDGDFVSLQAEIDEYENSDDAWLSDSEDEKDNPFQDEFLGAAVSPMFSPGFELVKMVDERPFAAPDLEEVKTSTFGVDLQPQEEFGSETMSMGVDLLSPESEFESAVIMTGVDPTPKDQDFESSTLIFGVDAEPSPVEEFGSGQLSFGVDPEPVEEFKSMSMSTGVDAAPQEEFGSQSMSTGVDVAPKEEFGSVKMSTGVDVAPKEEFGSMSMSTGVEPEAPPPPPETEFETVTTSTGVEPRKANLTLEFSTTTVSVDAPKKRALQLEFSTTVSTIPQDRGHFEMVRGPMEGLSPVSTPKRGPSPAPEKNERSRARITAINVPRGTDEIVRSGLNFKNLLSHFSTLEQKNPGKPKWEANKAHELANRWIVDGDHKEEVSGKQVMARAADPHPREAQKIVTRVVRTKFRTIKPKYKGYMRVLKTTTLAPHVVATSPNYFFCLDGLPSTTNVDRSEPDWQKDRRKDQLVPCIFFFENERRYRDFVKEAGGLPVREISFQKSFSQYATGVIPLESRTVGTEESQCVQQLGRELRKVVRLPVGMAEQAPASRNDPFLFVVGEEESHKFLCESVQARNEWLIQIARLIRKRKEMGDNRKKSGFSHSTPTPGIYKMPMILDESYTQEEEMD